MALTMVPTPATPDHLVSHAVIIGSTEVRAARSVEEQDQSEKSTLQTSSTSATWDMDEMDLGEVESVENMHELPCYHNFLGLILFLGEISA